MTLPGVEELSLWIEFLLTLICVGLFLYVSRCILHSVKRLQGLFLTPAAGRSPALRAFKPTYSSRVRIWYQRSRGFRLKHFLQVSQSVRSDAQDMLDGKEDKRYEARALIPLIVEVKRLGAKLRAEKRPYHEYLYAEAESHVQASLKELEKLEDTLKSLPQPVLKIEDL